MIKQKCHSCVGEAVFTHEGLTEGIYEARCDKCGAINLVDFAHVLSGVLSPEGTKTPK